MGYLPPDMEEKMKKNAEEKKKLDTASKEKVKDKQDKPKDKSVKKDK